MFEPRLFIYYMSDTLSEIEDELRSGQGGVQAFVGDLCVLSKSTLSIRKSFGLLCESEVIKSADECKSSLIFV